MLKKLRANIWEKVWWSNENAPTTDGDQNCGFVWMKREKKLSVNLLHTFNRHEFLHKRAIGSQVVWCESPDKYKDIRTQAREKSKEKSTTKITKKRKKRRKHTKRHRWNFKYIHSQRDADLENSLCSPFMRRIVHKRMEWMPGVFSNIVAMHTIFLCAAVVVQSLLCTAEWMLTLSLSTHNLGVVHLYTCANVIERPQPSLCRCFYLRRHTHKNTAISKRKLRIRFVRFSNI